MRNGGDPTVLREGLLQRATLFLVSEFGSALIVVSALLTGCASLPETLDAGPVNIDFELVGRVAVRHGREGMNGRVVWRHGPDFDEMLITSVLGQGIASITRRRGSVELVTADRSEYRATEAEALTERILGWRLPLAGLPDWVQGRADPAYPAKLARDARSRLRELEQNGWWIQYQEYEGARPLMLRMSRDNLEIRLIVDEWTAPQ